MASNTQFDFARVTPDEVAAAAGIAASTIHEAAGRIGDLPAGIKPLDAKMRVAGPAFTVKGAPGDNVWLHHAIHHAQPGDVLVADVGGLYDAGYWGEVMTVAAQAQGIAGLVIDGCVRDGAEMVAMGFPTFARGLCMRGTAKDHTYKGALAVPLAFGDVIVNPGDLVLGDGDGVVVIPRAQVAEATAASHAREEKERQTMELLRSGKTTVDIYGWKMAE